MIVQHPQRVISDVFREVQIRGYAGLERFPLLPSMMRHPVINQIHTFFYRFNDPDCPAGILLADPLHPTEGEKSRHDPQINRDQLAWLYVRRHGDVTWSRDLLAAKGSGRHAFYLQSCTEGYQWEQQLGDLLDHRKSLNLWVAVKVT